MPTYHYDGEYIMDINKHNLANPNPVKKAELLVNFWYGAKGTCYSLPRYLTDEIELVSYPFWANTTRTYEEDEDGNTMRIFTVLSDEKSSAINYNTIRPALSGVMFELDYELTESRTLIPHSVYRHKLFIHCNEQNTIPTPLGTKLDSLVFTNDLTRGVMREYPFSPQNNVGFETTAYDVILYPFFFLNDNYEASNSNEANFYSYVGGGSMSIDLCNAVECSDNYINYFPIEDVTNIDICEEVSCFYPENPTSNEDPVGYIHPSPFSLAGFLMQGANSRHPVGYTTDTNQELVRLPGIPHTYIIDKNINLNLINPSEKIIYNPSQVHIEADNLVFPSGYTFKTVRGLYPTIDEVNNVGTDRCPEIATIEDQRDVPVPTDLQEGTSYTLVNGNTITAPSIYIIEPNSKLTIEPCVFLYDVTFIVKNGAKLIYHPDQTYGNYQIIEDELNPLAYENPNEVETISLPNKKCHNCQCVQEFNQVGDLDITTGVTVWEGDRIINGQITVKSGATLHLINGEFAFADANANQDDNIFTTGITVEAGGKLELLNAKLTTINGIACKNRRGEYQHEMWDGIRLKGVNYNHFGQNALFRADNSSIEYARTGIQAEAFTYPNGNLMTNVGTQVLMSNCHFLNNHTSVLATGPNLGHVFVGCTFDMTEPIRDTNISPEGSINSHVTLYNQSQGTSFQQCVFRNSIGNQFYINQRGTGITAIEASVEVKPYNEPAQPHPPTPLIPMNDDSEFTNLYKGVDYYTFIGDFSTEMRIVGATFEQVAHGITDNGGNGDVIHDNTFLQGLSGEWEDERDDYTGPDLPNDSWAVYMIGAQDYQITVNRVDISSVIFDENFSIQHYGVIAKNAGESGASIYDNDFEQISFGTQTEENNKMLEIRCNEYLHVRQDWAINPEEGSSLIPDLLANQGSGCGPSETAGNLFYNSCFNNSTSRNIGLGEINGNPILVPERKEIIVCLSKHN